MNTIDELHAEAAQLQQSIRELEQAEALIHRELPKARQALSAVQGRLQQLHMRDHEQRRAARQAELDQLQAQLSEARQ